MWEESELEKNGLIDFESYYNSSYNFYEQYYKDLSENEVDFDLMMFWDFLGSFFYDSFNFGCASIFFFIVNLIVLAFIGGFNFLDIDEKTHKYSFFQIAYITLVYLILWIAVGSSVLLSQQVYIDYFNILNEKRQKERKRREEMEKKSEDSKEDNNNEQLEKEGNKISSNDDIESRNKDSNNTVTLVDSSGLQHNTSKSKKIVLSRIMSASNNDYTKYNNEVFLNPNRNSKCV